MSPTRSLVLHASGVNGPTRSLMVCTADFVLSSRTPLTTFRVQTGASVDPAGFLHKHFQRHSALLTARDVSQCARPFAASLAIDILTGAANDGSEWIYVVY